MNDEELEALVLETIRRATERAVEAFPDGYTSKRALETLRLGYVQGYMDMWTDATTFPKGD